MGEDRLSPDGRHVVQLSCYEMRMSHWVCTPTLKALATGKEIFDLYPTVWSADLVIWSPDSATLDMGLRLYPGSGPGAHVTIQLNENHAIVERAGVTYRVSIAEAEVLFKTWSESERGY